MDDRNLLGGIAKVVIGIVLVLVCVAALVVGICYVAGSGMGHG